MLKAENFQEKFLTGLFYIIGTLNEKIINRIPIIGEKNIDNFLFGHQSSSLHLLTYTLHPASIIPHSASLTLKKRF